MNVAVPGEGSIHAFWVIVIVMVVILGSTLGYFRYRRFL
jgi:Mg2+ and Co2+ transporter CorA